MGCVMDEPGQDPSKRSPSAQVRCVLNEGRGQEEELHGGDRDTAGRVVSVGSIAALVLQ